MDWLAAGSIGIMALDGVISSVVSDTEGFTEELANYLTNCGMLDSASLERAMRTHQASGKPLHHLLPMLGMVSEQDIATAVAKVTGLALATASDYPKEPILPKNLSASFLRSSRVAPLAESSEAMVIAAADPLDNFTIRALRLFVDKPIDVKVGLPADIEGALDQQFGQSEIVDDIINDQTITSDQDATNDIQRLRDLASEAPVIRLVNRVITKAIEQRASDIHIEPSEHSSCIRYRIDGLLQESEKVAGNQHAALVSRLKIMANLNIAERRLPQDGRIKLAVRGRHIDFRIATLPIMAGESVVLRILDRDNVTLDFEALGFEPTNLSAYRSAINKPNGITLVTGPTGSGKTTTLYTSLSEISSRERKVLTVEDPIEFQLSGINQIQIKPQIGLTFAHVLRAMLRHDPDVIMVGEIRDLETAEITIQAALTGHLVFSTLHTNSAASTLIRLKDMGVEPFLIASTLNAVVAQRLVRKLCHVCRRLTDPIPEVLDLLNIPQCEVKGFWQAKGCDACGRTGYRGRVSINEIIVMSDPIRQAILQTTDANSIQKIACQEGMRPMFLDGVDKMMSGITSLEEVLRVTCEDS